MVQITSSEQQPIETKGSKKEIEAKWFWIILGIFGLIMVIAIGSGGDTQPPATETPATETQKLSIGEEGIINFRENKNECSGEDKVLLGTTKEAQGKVTKTLLAKDEMGIAELLLTGEAFGVPICTKAKIIDSAVGIRQVRILEGENVGRSGWLPYEWIK